jgi:hypothetical protein
MLAVQTTTTEPDVSESFSRTVEAPEATARSAAERIDLVGPLVEALIAAGVQEHIATPCSDGLVWRFAADDPGRLRIAWDVTVTPETEDASLVSISLHATANDDATRERLLESWPVIGSVAELHAHRLLHRIEALAEEEVEDPFRAAA